MAPLYKQTNPFTPVFGHVPAVMAGRESIIDDMLDAFEGNGSSPDLCSIFTGARGTGKTALLTYLGFRAEQAGWIVAKTTATKGMLEDLYQRALDASSHLVDSEPDKKLTSIEIAPFGGVSWDNRHQDSRNWRSKMTDLLNELAKTDTGLLLMVDEVDGTLDEMTLLATVYQMFVGEGRKVSLLMAGLPYRVSTLLSGRSTSFLRRAARHELGSIVPYEVREAFRLTVADGGKKITDDALSLACESIHGFPFMFQLVGYRSWNAARDAQVIDAEDVQAGAAVAQEELKDRVFDATLDELSKGDVRFIQAMDRSGALTDRADLTKKLKKSSSYISTYKKRLLEAGVIEEPVTGKFGFALPGFADYLTEKGL